MSAKIEFTKEQLEEMKHLYVDEEWSTAKIGEYFNCGGGVIANRLKNMDVKIRPSGFQKGNKVGVNRIRSKDLTGQVFGKLTVLGPAPSRPQNPSGKRGYSWVKCSCGLSDIHQVRNTHLTTGAIKSCGLCNKESHIKYREGDNIYGTVLLERIDNWKGKFQCSNCKKPYLSSYWSVYYDRNVLCPSCKGNISKGELLISQILKELNIEFLNQYTFKDCRRINPLPFDFYLPDYNICIEYDGEEHFQPVEFFGGEEKFQRRIENDEIKNNYCKNNNIKLIRIPYFDKAVIDDKYLLNKIEGIND